ncbi:amino acid adenylation domain-containing protein [Nannocystaceae bacterium ST9]
MSGGTLVELLERARGSTGGGIVDGDRRRSWSELIASGEAGASWLREYGVGPGHRVALCLHPGIDLTIAAFASLLAGAAYVPLDPLSPVRRSAMICTDARASVLVADTPAFVERLLAEPGLAHRPRLIVLSGAASPSPITIAGIPVVEFAAFAAARSNADRIERMPVPEPEPESLAYVLFTSGSTGRPKGVAISHRAARCFVDWSRECVDLQPDDRVAALTPLHFDLSVFDLYASFAAGATMVAIPRRLVGFASELVSMLAEQAVTVVYTVPTLLVQMVARTGALDLPRLRVVMFAGEPFPIKHLRALMLALPGRRYLNLYGPTETNVVTVHEVESVPAEDGPATPIGVACAGAELFLLDEQGEPHPLAPGQVGELCVAGPVLMQGYWDVEDPGGHAGLVIDPRGTGALVHRTGDRVRVDEAGRLIWLGRISQTIKCAGYRIEPGEIEHRLLEHPGVREAYVVVRPHPTLGGELEAVIVPSGDVELDARELQRHCALGLPRWMVPTHVRVVAEVPRTSTGKVDRRALIGDAQEVCS